jgi:hypothetical protein
MLAAARMGHMAIVSAEHLAVSSQSVCCDGAVLTIRAIASWRCRDVDPMEPKHFGVGVLWKFRMQWLTSYRDFFGSRKGIVVSRKDSSAVLAEFNKRIVFDRHVVFKLISCSHNVHEQQQHGQQQYCSQSEHR